MTDPTLTLLNKFEDPTAWDEVLDNVPVFTPHQRKFTGKDGQERVEVVDEARLHRAAAVINRRVAEAGVPVTWTIGHRKPGAPQQDQPAVVAFAKDARVGPWGPKGQPALLVKRYTPKGHGDAVKKYPFRSAEFYPDSDEITNVALLLTDPKLDMGVLAYERDRPLYYQGMADPAMEPDKDDPDPEFAEKVCRVLETKYPFLDQLKEKLMSQSTPPTPAPTAAPPGAPPAAPAPAPAPSTYEQDRFQLRYEKLEAENSQLKTRLEALESRDQKTRADYARADSKRRISALLADGYRIKDTDKELERMVRLDDAGRDERETEIRENYERAPVAASFVRVHEGNGATDPADRLPTEEELKKAAHYMREQQWDNLPREELERKHAVALAHVRGQAK